MADESYTFIVVPHAKARMRRFQVSVKLIKWTAAIALILGVALTGVLVHYASVSVEVYDQRRVKAENQDLRAKNHEYEQHVGQLQNRVQYLQNMVTKLGVMAGLEQSLPQQAPPVGGVGGVPGAESVAPSLEVGSLQSMENSLAALTVRSAKLEEFYRSQSVRLSSTPSIWPVRGYLSSGFGNRVDPFTGSRDFHPGIDISTPERHQGRRPRRRRGRLLRAEGRLRQRHHRGPRVRHHHALRPPGGLQRAAGPAAEARRRARLRGQHGPLHLAPPPLRGLGQRPGQNPIHFILDEYRSFG